MGALYRRIAKRAIYRIFLDGVLALSLTSKGKYPITKAGISIIANKFRIYILSGCVVDGLSRLKCIPLNYRISTNVIDGYI